MDIVNSAVASTGRPVLAPHVRLRLDPTRNHHVLLSPETVIVLNRTGADILQLCDGRHTVAEIAAQLRRRYDRVLDDELRSFLARLAAKRCLEIRDG
jgi:pyrroloquinoline quinone biosynthesis protein D